MSQQFPRGIRNNNPGNIESNQYTQDYSGYQGSDGRFAQFETPAHGIGAMARLLRIYQEKHGLNTVQGMISRWAPSTENDTNSYVNSVASHMGIDPNEGFSFRDQPELAASMMEGMARHENGMQPFSREDFLRGHEFGTGGVKTDPDNPTADRPSRPSPASEFTVDKLPTNFNRNQELSTPLVRRDSTVSSSSLAGTPVSLRNIISLTAMATGRKVDIVAAKEPRSGGLHPDGLALDVVIYDENGNPIPTGAGGLESTSEAARGFGAYEAFAKVARQIQQKYYPELSDEFRWGGYFSGSPSDYGSLDTMQFDLGGRQGLGMLGGSWDSGLTKEQKQLYEAAGFEINTEDSNGIAQDLLGQSASDSINTRFPAAGVSDTDQPAYSVFEQSANADIGFNEIPAPSYSRTPTPQAQDSDTPGFFDVIPAAAQSTMTHNVLFNNTWGYTPDENFSLSEDWIKENASDIPTQYLDGLTSSVSEDHANAQIDRIKERMDQNRQLAEAGYSGIAASLVTSLLDPAAIAAAVGIGAVTGGTGAAAVAAARFGRIGTAALSAAEGAAGNVAVDVPMIAADPTRDWRDLKYSIGTGMVLGAAAGQITHRGDFIRGQQREMSRIGADLQKEALKGLSEPGNTADVDTLQQLGQGRSVGAAESGVITGKVDDMERAYKAAKEEFEPFAKSVRFDLESQANKSPNPVTPTLMSRLVFGGAGMSKGVTPHAASEEMDRLFRPAQARWTRAAAEQWEKVKRRKGINLMNEGEERRKFMREVTDAATEWNPGVRNQYSPEARAAASEIRQIMKDHWDMAKRANLNRTEEGVDFYMPRTIDRGATWELHADIGDKGFEDVFFNAIREAQPDIPEKLAKKIAKAYRKRYLSLAEGQEMSGFRGDQGIEPEEVRAILEEHGRPAGSSQPVQAAQEVEPETPKKMEVFGEELDPDTAIKKINEEIEAAIKAEKAKKTNKLLQEDFERKLKEWEDTKAAQAASREASTDPRQQKSEIVWNGERMIVDDALSQINQMISEGRKYTKNDWIRMATKAGLSPDTKKSKKDLVQQIYRSVLNRRQMDNKEAGILGRGDSRDTPKKTANEGLEDSVENELFDAIEKIQSTQRESNDWVSIVELKESLGVDKDLDPLLNKLRREKKLLLTLEEDQGRLTQKQRDMSVQVGPDKMHYVTFTDQGRPRKAGEVPDPPKKPTFEEEPQTRGMSVGELEDLKAEAKKLSEAKAASKKTSTTTTTATTDQTVDGTFLTDDEIESIIEKMTKSTESESPDGPSGPSRFKHRVLLEENKQFAVKDKYGNRRSIGVKDFMVRDAHTLMTMYNRQVSGAIAKANVRIPNPLYRGEGDDPTGLGPYLIDGIKSKADEEKAIRNLKEVGRVSGSSPDRNDVDGELIQFAFDVIGGVPAPGSGTRWGRSAALIRDFNFLRLMGQVGIAQLPELGRVVATSGVRTLMKALPIYRKTVKDLQTGRASTELAEELDLFFGAPGADWDVYRFHTPQDSFSTPVTTQRGGGAFEATEEAVHKSSRFLTKASGMEPINKFLEKSAMTAFTINMTKKALNETGASALSTKRLNLLGLDEKMTKRIFNQIRKHSDFDGARRAGRLKKLQLAEWDDQEAASAFMRAGFRGQRNAVLRNDLGQMNPWMRHPIMGLVLQFRSFQIGAWTRATLQGLNMRDLPALNSAVLGMLIGSLAYAGQTHVRLIGDSDAERKRQDRLTMEELGKAAFMRTAESSITTSAVDIGADLLGYNSVFSYSRTSGLAAGLAGVPAVDFFTNGQRAVSGIGSAALGDDYSKQDLEAFFELTPFQNTVGYGNFLTWLASELPDEEEER